MINVHYINVLSKFKTKDDDYIDLKKTDEPDFPLINHMDNSCEVIKWDAIFLDCVSRTYVSKPPLVYVLQDNATVNTEVDYLTS